MTSILIIAVAAVIGELLGTIVGHEIGLQMDRNAGNAPEMGWKQTAPARLRTGSIPIPEGVTR